MVATGHLNNIPQSRNRPAGVFDFEPGDREFESLRTRHLRLTGHVVREARRPPCRQSSGVGAARGGEETSHAGHHLLFPTTLAGNHTRADMQSIWDALVIISCRHLLQLKIVEAG